jgi:hypothetical protein
MYVQSKHGELFSGNKVSVGKIIARMNLRTDANRENLEVLQLTLNQQHCHSESSEDNWMSTRLPSATFDRVGCVVHPLPFVLCVFGVIKRTENSRREHKHKTVLAHARTDTIDWTNHFFLFCFSSQKSFLCVLKQGTRVGKMHLQR